MLENLTGGHPVPNGDGFFPLACRTVATEPRCMLRRKPPFPNFQAVFLIFSIAVKLEKSFTGLRLAELNFAKGGAPLYQASVSTLQFIHLSALPNPVALPSPAKARA